jgi:acyl-CoA thioester hydrolase
MDPRRIQGPGRSGPGDLHSALMVYDDRGLPRLLPGEIVGVGREPAPDDPRDLPGDFSYRRPIEVRFGDTDAMGHVNNAVYLTYVELARAGYYRAATGGRVGIGALERDQAFILAEARLTFRAPAYFGEVLTIEARTSRIGRSSFTMDFRITAPEGLHGAARLVAVATSIQVGYDYEHDRTEHLDDHVVSALETFEGHRLRD